MSKHFKLIENELCKSIEVSQPVPKNEIDWDECVLCQEFTEDPLQCPATSRKTNAHKEQYYRSLEDDIRNYSKLNDVPLHNRFVQLEQDGFTLSDAFSTNHAKWHKLCRRNTGKNNAQRAAKRKADSDTSQQVTPAKLTRLSTGAAAKSEIGKCFFCGDSNGNLHQVSTFEMDRSVRKYALELQDTVLLAKLSVGDMISQEAVYHLKCYRDLFHRKRKESVSTPMTL
ncbi:hypothetical protein DPMN_059997 [Dreissena polymorpha]|uniref:Uncharacterized protein n=1 Tax=Dreissena polymorpha TaxID=45954 RepID=A0A9D4HHR0_DREPO|nr:hypothetical protein DPMN_059997 [Dreissena polymorpha]